MACELLEGESDQDVGTGSVPGSCRLTLQRLSVVPQPASRSSQLSTGPGFHDRMELVTLRSPILHLASPAGGGLIDDGLVGT